jgi:hypothetical protein
MKSPIEVFSKWADEGRDEAIETFGWNGQKNGIQTVSDRVSNNDNRMIWSKVEFNK